MADTVERTLDDFSKLLKTIFEEDDDVFQVITKVAAMIYEIVRHEMALVTYKISLIKPVLRKKIFRVPNGNRTHDLSRLPVEGNTKTIWLKR